MGNFLSLFLILSTSSLAADVAQPLIHFVFAGDKVANEFDDEPGCPAQEEGNDQIGNES